MRSWRRINRSRRGKFSALRTATTARSGWRSVTTRRMPDSFSGQVLTTSGNRRGGPPLPTDPGYDPLQERRPQVLFSDWSPRVVTAHDENVEVYSNCDQVELFLNGKSLGAKPRPSDDAPRNWKVPFEMGTLKAIGMNKGRVAATYELQTADKPSRIMLSADRNTVAPVWDDVVYVAATVVDENGVLVPNAGDLITFKIAGPGVVAAVDSGNNNSHEQFQAVERKAYQGRCFSLLKAKAAAGRITLEATASSLQSKAIIINTVRTLMPRSREVSTT